MGAPVSGDRDRDGDRDGEGLTMRANSSATQRGEMCDVSGVLNTTEHKLIKKIHCNWNTACYKYITTVEFCCEFICILHIL